MLAKRHAEGYFNRKCLSKGDLTQTNWKLTALFALLSLLLSFTKVKCHLSHRRLCWIIFASPALAWLSKSSFARCSFRLEEGLCSAERKQTERSSSWRFQELSGCYVSEASRLNHSFSLSLTIWPLKTAVVLQQCWGFAKVFSWNRHDQYTYSQPFMCMYSNV